MCKVSRETMCAEAVKRMEMFGLFKPCINAFKRNEIQLSEPTGALYEFSDNWELNKIVKEVEEKYSSVVYHVIHCYTDFGELYNLLFVPNDKSYWESERAEIADGYVFAYCANMSVPEYSEFGTICVKPKFGGLVRVG